MASFDAIRTLPDGQCGGNGFLFLSFFLSCGKTKEKKKPRRARAAGRTLATPFNTRHRDAQHTQGK